LLKGRAKDLVYNVIEHFPPNSGIVWVGCFVNRRFLSCGIERQRLGSW
jgi:hypothetical protein